MNLRLLADYMPVHIHWEQGKPMVDWCYFGEARFVEPFFEDTVKKRLRDPFAALFHHQTTLGILAELQASDPGVPPTGFIFHMSRCGSTLVAQMLAALAQNIVISEAGPIDALLRSHCDDPRITAEQRIAWLRGLLSAFARPRKSQARHFFVKFDSWHTLALPLIQKAFPDVPWLFLYRDPIKVLVSHARQRGAQMAPGLLAPEWFGWDRQTITQFSLDEYCARVLASISQAAVQHRNANALFVNYCQLPAAVWTEIAGHFQLEYAAPEVEQMRQAAQFDAKTPGLFFVDDTPSKNQLATVALRQLAEQWLMPLYRTLETR